MLQSFNHFVLKAACSWSELLNYLYINTVMTWVVASMRSNKTSLSIYIYVRQLNGRDSHWCEERDPATASKCLQYLFLSVLLPPCAREQSRRYGSLPKLFNDIQLLATRLRSTSPLEQRTSNQSEGEPSLVLQPRLRNHNIYISTSFML